MTELKLKVQLISWVNKNLDGGDQLVFNFLCPIDKFRCISWNAMLTHLTIKHSPFDFIEIECVRE